MDTETGFHVRTDAYLERRPGHNLFGGVMGINWGTVPLGTTGRISVQITQFPKKPSFLLNPH